MSTWCASWGYILPLPARVEWVDNAVMNIAPKPANTFSSRMKQDWDARAREDARWYIATRQRGQADRDFDATGGQEVDLFVSRDPLIYPGSDPKQLRLIEIGCGIGRMTRHLAKIFGEVYATDVSGEMIRQARERLRDLDNVFVYETSGVDLAAFPAGYFDVAFCAYVFQHVPDVSVVEANIREASRVLKPGGRFKFQTNAVASPDKVMTAADTWTGVAFGEAELRRIAAAVGMHLVSLAGAGTSYCWVVMRKPLRTDPAAHSVAAARIVLCGATDAPNRHTIRPGNRQPGLAIVVGGIDPDAADLNRVGVSLGGHAVTPCYCGPLRENVARHLLLHPSAEVMRLQDLVQIEVLVGAHLPAGQATVELKLNGEPLPVSPLVELLPPAPLVPRISFVGNAVDGGADIMATGEKSVIRILVEDLDPALVNDVRVRLDDVLIQPARVEFIASHAMHMITASLPQATHPGNRRITIIAGDQESPTQQVTILPVGADVLDHWYRRVGETLAETGEIDNPWIRPHQRRYAATFAELDRLDGERHAALEIGVTRLFPFLLTADLGYRRVFGTHFMPDRPDRKRERIAISAFGRRVTAVTFNVNLEHDPIPLPDASLDLVLCCEVIEHMDVDPMFLFAEINRIVKPGGHLFVTTPNIASGRAVWKMLNGYAPHFFTQYTKDRSPYRHNYEHDIHSLQALTRAAGFETRMLKTLDVFEEPEPRALLALDRLGMTTAFRGDDIFLLGQKTGPVIDRWPSTIYV